MAILGCFGGVQNNPNNNVSELEKLIYTHHQLSKVDNKYMLFDVFNAIDKIAERIRKIMIDGRLSSIDSPYHKQIVIDGSGVMTITH